MSCLNPEEPDFCPFVGQYLCTKIYRNSKIPVCFHLGRKQLKKCVPNVRLVLLRVGVIITFFSSSFIDSILLVARFLFYFFFTARFHWQQSWNHLLWQDFAGSQSQYSPPLDVDAWPFSLRTVVWRPFLSLLSDKKSTSQTLHTVHLCIYLLFSTFLSFCFVLLYLCLSVHK